MTDQPVDGPASPGPIANLSVPQRSSESPIIVDFEELARGAKELLITYQGQHYRLRLTRNHKLILTK